jgi:hypothetical protein
MKHIVILDSNQIQIGIFIEHGIHVSDIHMISATSFLTLFLIFLIFLILRPIKSRADVYEAWIQQPGCVIGGPLDARRSERRIRRRVHSLR